MQLHIKSVAMKCCRHGVKGQHMKPIKEYFFYSNIPIPLKHTFNLKHMIMIKAFNWLNVYQYCYNDDVFSLSQTEPECFWWIGRWPTWVDQVLDRCDRSRLIHLFDFWLNFSTMSLNFQQVNILGGHSDQTVGRTEKKEETFNKGPLLGSAFYFSHFIIKNASRLLV